MSALVCLALLSVSAEFEGGMSARAQTANAPAPERPIVAALFAEPSRYAGMRIQIYGLVVSSDIAKHTFELQDVSQRPLTIDGRRLPPVVTGDQVEIEGTVHVTSAGLVLVGEHVKSVKVTGGGGCC